VCVCVCVREREREGRRKKRVQFGAFVMTLIVIVSGGTPSMAVVLQQQLNPVSAGVLFTLNPLTHNQHQMVVESAWGLGEGKSLSLSTPCS
jgi:hypothetical protein